MLAPTDPLAIEARYKAPLVVLHRATLQSALLADGIADLVEPGVEVTAAGEANGSATVELGDGSSIAADLVIGADGMNSTLRAGLLGHAEPRHSGLLAYRAIADRSSGSSPSGEYWGKNGIFGLVPIDGDRIYWYATRHTDGGEPPEPDPIGALLGRFADWAPEIGTAIEATRPESVLRHDLVDREPTKRWVAGRLALLGDAAHPMLPFLGQGACQALEDAVALGQAIADNDDSVAALRTYEERRRDRAAMVVRESRRFGQISHLRSAALRRIRDRAVMLTPERARLRRLDSIVGRD